ncbi:hypothetical protein SteCoe_26442 [Stentor coeruleus]|uniref:Amino acid transporter transmembrane domain-containing protein n=1 Tax=Stentor coeruleus TaxID=5963 RepID=A0A1R2BD71_9CILI|nr:hypothetical protein SteCoe_26442 [Stentor coeruleus]
MGDTKVVPITYEHSMENYNDVALITTTKTVKSEPKISRKFTKKLLLDILNFPFMFIHKNFQPGDIKGSALTIFASTVGVGILSLPYAVNISGLYQGIIIFILGIIVSLYTCQLLVLASEKTGEFTYELIGKALYGPKMKTFAEINMIINNYGFAVAYIILLKDLIPNCLKMLGVVNATATNNYLWGCLVCILIIYPLTLKKKISALRYTSLLSCIACIYLSIVIAYGFFTTRANDLNSKIKEAPPAEISTYSIFTASSYVVFSFTCQNNVIPIYQELQQRNTKRGFQFLLRGLLMVFVLYLIVGIFGFLTFYDKYHPITNFPVQILEADYGEDNIPIIIASIAIAITLICGTPLVFQPCRIATLSILFQKEPTKKQYFFIVTGLVFSALGLALATPNIGYALNIIGTISSPIVCFILPCMYYIKAFPGKFTRYDLLIAYAVLVFMTFIGVSGFVIFLMDSFF